MQSESILRIRSGGNRGSNHRATRDSRVTGSRHPPAAAASDLRRKLLGRCRLPVFSATPLTLWLESLLRDLCYLSGVESEYEAFARAAGLSGRRGRMPRRCGPPSRASRQHETVVNIATGWQFARGACGRRAPRSCTNCCPRVARTSRAAGKGGFGRKPARPEDNLVQRRDLVSIHDRKSWRHDAEVQLRAG